MSPYEHVSDVAFHWILYDKAAVIQTLKVKRVSCFQTKLIIHDVKKSSNESASTSSANLCALAIMTKAPTRWAR